MSNDALAHPDRIRASHWITVLRRQFPELQSELAPSPHRPGLGRPRGGADRRGPSEPLRLRVSDTVRDITDGVVELEEAVHDRLGLPPTGRGTVEARLARLAELLERVEADPSLMRHLLDEVSGMARRCSGTLGDAEPVVRLRGRCPLCASVSLRAFPLRRAVLCINPGCRCPHTACGCHADRAHRHSWPEGEWAELAVGGAVVLEEITAALNGGSTVVAVSR
ncbi:hypothetical protein QR300_39445 [Streptomyces antimycoticus]|uniref:Uncharacterized protein n=1 Tax=Streptomyces mordarskii TaxID=1226758 RepID=A0ABP3PJP2_9ACTN|nr:hypothetical protein [Streptomyces antimycoticus]WJE01526.1 hypothetical protein QR300_39445 [Streptomyces antimycoticus]WTB10577.1 hypothetical protein OG546_44410 [Streptomyces antimycoticus]